MIRIENEMNQMAVWLMAKEQPVARDLRRIIRMIKMSSDIERIADFAVNRCDFIGLDAARA